MALAILSLLQDKLLSIKQADKIIMTLKKTEDSGMSEHTLLSMALKFKVKLAFDEGGGDI
jgi:hypothetical protein